MDMPLEFVLAARKDAMECPALAEGLSNSNDEDKKCVSSQPNCRTEAWRFCQPEITTILGSWARAGI